MRQKISNNAGFTLIEILVSIAILTLLMLTSFIYLRSNNTSVQVRSAASVLSDALRTAQGNAQSGVLVGVCPNCKVPSAFGVKIKTVSGVPTVILYADVDQGTTPADHIYSVGAPGITEEAYPDLAKGTVRIDKMSLGGNSGSTIKSIIGANASTDVDIVFATPTAVMYIDGDTTKSTVTITLQDKKNTITKDVVIDRVTGRIEPKF